MPGYDDGRVALTDQGLVLRNYYAPFWSKRISYETIREVRQVPNKWKWRLSGSGDLSHWLNWDPQRPRKDRALVIYLYGKIAARNTVSVLKAPDETEQWIKPVMTPDDPDRVVAELAAHGVNVTSGLA